jgi:hypothetical protein
MRDSIPGLAAPPPCRREFSILTIRVSNAAIPQGGARSSMSYPHDSAGEPATARRPALRKMAGPLLHRGPGPDDGAKGTADRQDPSRPAFRHTDCDAFHSGISQSVRLL